MNILEDLGPTFVKIGQIASQQAEFIPPEYCDALIKLRSKVAPMDVETVHSQIEKHLGKSVNELYASFDDQALGSASISQVHKAELFDGTVVAVKVRRPGVVDTVARDFALIEKVLNQFVKGDIGGIDIKGMIKELENTSKRELDFTNEAANIELFYQNNAGFEGIEVPKCYRDLTCEAVLTEDFVTGNEAGDIAFIETLDEKERERIASLIADNFASQVLTSGFYHADPHSGNVFIKMPVPPRTPADETEEDKETKAAKGKEGASADQKMELPEHNIEWIDFGMMGTLTSKERQILIDIVTNVVMQDAYSLKRSVMQVAQPKGEIDHGAMLEMCEQMCSEYTGADFGDFDLGDLLGTILGALQDEDYKIDPFLTNLSRGIIAMEGTLKTICPTVNILNYFTAKVDTGFSLDFNTDNLKELNPEIGRVLIQFAKGTTDTAIKTAETLDMLEKGQIKVHADIGMADRTVAVVSRLTGYAIRALLIIAFFIGSCLLCTAPAKTGDGMEVADAFAILGTAGYIISVFFGYRLYKDMKKGK